MCGCLTHGAHLHCFFFGLAYTSRLAFSARRGEQATPRMLVFLVRMFIVPCTIAQYLVQLLSALLNAAIRASRHFLRGVFWCISGVLDRKCVCVCVCSINSLSFQSCVCVCVCVLVLFIN